MIREVKQLLESSSEKPEFTQNCERDTVQDRGPEEFEVFVIPPEGDPVKLPSAFPCELMVFYPSQDTESPAFSSGIYLIFNYRQFLPFSFSLSF